MNKGVVSEIARHTNLLGWQSCPTYHRPLNKYKLIISGADVK